MRLGKWMLTGFLLTTLVLQPIQMADGAEQQDVSKSVVSGSQTFATTSGKRTVQFVRINLNDVRLEFRPVLAHQELGKTESLESIAKRNGALAAINGTFFMAYNKEAYKPPWGKIVIDYSRVNDGSSGASIGFNGNLLPVISSTTQMDDRSFEHITSAGPTLLKDGKIVVNPQAEGMTDLKLTTLSGQRSFIGYTADNQVVMGTVPNVTLAQLATICQSMRLTAAMNMDGGASSGLYAHGKMLTQPGRELSNALLIIPRKTPVVQVFWEDRQLSFTYGPLRIHGSVYVPAAEFLEQWGALVTPNQQDKQITATRDGKEILLSENGQWKMTGEGNSTRLPTRMIAGKQMVSLRAIVEALGMQVEWDPQTSKARIIDK